MEKGEEKFDGSGAGFPGVNSGFCWTRALEWRVIEGLLRTEAEAVGALVKRKAGFLRKCSRHRRLERPGAERFWLGARIVWPT